MDVFDIVKAKLPDTEDETAIAMQIAEVGLSIKTFINSDTIPADLVFVHANMVVDLIKGEQRKANPDAQQTVSDIKEGDVSVKFGAVRADSRELAMESILYSYAPQMYKFRKMRR